MDATLCGGFPSNFGQAQLVLFLLMRHIVIIACTYLLTCSIHTFNHAPGMWLTITILDACNNVRMLVLPPTPSAHVAVDNFVLT